MPRKKAEAPPVATTPSGESSSEEVQVILPAPDEPVRRGGYVLTDDGWRLETDEPAAAPDTDDTDEENED